MKTARAAHLGARLRELREAVHLKPDAACMRLGWNRRRLDRIESGTTIPKPGDLQAMLDLYNAEPETQAALDVLRKEALAGRRGWWVGYAGVFKGPLPAMESSATRIRCFEVDLIPGLAQTASYARELFAMARPEDDTKAIDMRVAARRQRQTVVFEQQDPPEVHLIVDELALLRPVGGDDVMNDQISALWTLAQRPNVTVQIIPLDVGAHAAMGGPFMILNFDEEAYPEVAFTAGQAGDVYLEGEADLRRLASTWDRLAMAALSPDVSARRCAELTS